MYVVIGKIETKDGNKIKLDACRIIDTDTREVMDISIVKIRNALRNGVHVLGFKANYSLKATKENIKVHPEVARSGDSKFRWRNIPRLTGNGELVDAKDAKYMTVIGWHGFAEMKKYHLVDWQGKEVVLSLNEFIEKVQADEINGAAYDDKYNRPTINKELNNEFIFNSLNCCS